MGLLLFNPLINSDLCAQIEACGGLTIFPFNEPVCRGDLLDLNYQLAPDGDPIEVFWHDDSFNNFAELDEPLLIEPSYVNCDDDQIFVFVEVFCPVNGEIEFYELEVEYYESVHYGLFTFDHFNCRLDISESCDYSFAFSVDGENIPIINGGIDLSEIIDPFDFVLIDIEMINPGAPAACNVSNMEYMLYDECFLQPEPCDDYTISDELSQDIYCTGDIISLEFEGDVSEIEFVSLSTYYGAWLEFEPLGFNGNNYEWIVSHQPWDCVSGPQNVILEIYCNDDSSQLIQLFFDYYASWDENTLPEIIGVDEFSCVIFISNPCDYIIELDPAGVYDESLELYEFDPEPGGQSINVSIQNPAAPADLECYVSDFELELICQICDFEVTIDQSEVCVGDLVNIDVSFADDNSNFFLNVLTPDGKFFSLNSDSASTIEWIVGSNGIVGTCAGEFELIVESSCSSFGTADVYPIKIFPTIDAGIQENEMVIDDCAVCVETFNSCPANVYEWLVNGVVDANIIGPCYVISELTPSPTQLSVRLNNPDTPEACFSNVYLEAAVPCTTCEAVENVLPETASYCSGDPISLWAGPPFSDYIYEWYLDDEIVSIEANYNTPIEFNNCVEFHELRAVVYCAQNGYVIADNTVDFTFYNNLGASTVVDDCYVELVPDCPDVTVFWSEGSQSGNGTVYVPNEGTTGEVTFVLASTGSILGCNQALYELAYACMEVGINDVSLSGFNLTVIGNELIIESHTEITASRFFGMNGQEFELTCNKAGMRSTCHLPSLSTGVYLVVLQDKAGNFAREKIYIK